MGDRDTRRFWEALATGRNLIRHELMDDDGTPLSGTVEADETYIGGYRKGTMGRGVGKTPVFGMVERKGRVVAVTVPNVKRATVMPHITQRVLPATMMYTDEYKVYKRLPQEGYNHRRINHSAKVYVSGDVHTNTIEGFWSLVKRGIDGVYHAVSAKHLQGYLNEYAWRYNARHAPQARFEALLGRAALGS